MPDITLSDEAFCIKSEIVNHERKLEWIIADVPKFKLLSPITITCKTFKLSPHCKYIWELTIALYVESIVIRISRQDELVQSALIYRSMSFQNSEGATYNPLLTNTGVVINGDGNAKQLLYFKLSKDFPLNLPKDELTLKIHLKLSNCCLITNEIKDPKLETMSGKSELSSNLLQGLQSSYLGMQPSDILLEVGDTFLPCHKFILSIRSTFFKKMLEDGNLEQNSVVKLEDMNEEALRGFVAYIYTNEICDVSSDAIRELYNAAVRYQIDGLQQKCSLMLIENLTGKNVCKALKLGDQHNDTNLKTASSAFILEHIEKLKDSPELSVFLKDDLLLFFQMLSISVSAKE